jgi:uncharacterized cupin superfamily protein
MTNLRDCELTTYDEGPAGRTFRMHRIGGEHGAKATGCTVYELDPGNASWPYHFELVEEEWLVVVVGEVVLRTPEGERELRAGDVACFPAGAAGAHEIANRGDATARFMLMSAGETRGGGAVYPDDGKFAIYAPGFSHRGVLGRRVGYWEDV